MTSRRAAFVPFGEVRRQPTIVVDSTGLGAALTLAHWRGGPYPPGPARRYQRRLVPARVARARHAGPDGAGRHGQSL